MNNPRSIRRFSGEEEGDAPPEGAPLGGTKAEAMQRLQVGLFGLGSMVLMIGLAGIIGNQADLTQDGAVPEAAPTTEPTEAAPQRDPLADAGIVPDIPAEPSPTPTPTPTLAPTGTAAGLPAGAQQVPNASANDTPPD